jgi:hypothetical protein
MSALSTLATEFAPHDTSYNAIVNVTLHNFRNAFTYTKTQGTDASLITHYKIDPSYDTNYFAPFANGKVVDVTNLGISYGNAIPQHSANFKNIAPEITGPTKPIFSDQSVEGFLNGAVGALPNVASRTYADASNNRIASDYLGFLGYQCFGNPSACNMFSNGTVQTYANTMPGHDDAFLANVLPHFALRDVTDADQYGVSGELIPNSAQNLCFLLFRQIMDRVPGRFMPGSEDYCLEQTTSEVDGEETWFLPVQPGDVLQCRIILKAAEHQSLFGQLPSQGTSLSTPIDDRRYLIRFIIDTSVPTDLNIPGTGANHDEPNTNL